VLYVFGEHLSLSYFMRIAMSVRGVQIHHVTLAKFCTNVAL